MRLLATIAIPLIFLVVGPLMQQVSPWQLFQGLCKMTGIVQGPQCPQQSNNNSQQQPNGFTQQQPVQSQPFTQSQSFNQPQQSNTNQQQRPPFAGAPTP